MWLAREQLMEGFGGRKAKIFGNVKVLIKKSWKWISPPSPPPHFNGELHGCVILHNF